MGDDEFHCKFIRSLTSDNQLEVRHMGLYKPINEILSTLEEIEIYKSDLATGINPTLQVQLPSSQTYTSVDINRIVNEKIQAMQRSYISSQPAPVSTSVPAPPPAPDPKYAAAHHKLLALTRHLDMNQYQLSGVSMLEIETFINKKLLANLPQNHDYHANINMHTTRVNNSFGDEYEVLKRSYATGTFKLRKCLNCGKSGHTKGSYSKSKKSKKKKKTNYAHDSSSSSESSSSDSSDSSDSNSSHTCYGLKKKSSENKHSGKKVKDKKKSHPDKRLIVFEVFQLLLKVLVQSFINSVLKETVISVYNALNAEFINYKEPILN
jgi:hypothetical protein